MYCALFWIQGKTAGRRAGGMFQLYCALFWIQGKTLRRRQPIQTELYCALFWIQGKTLSISSVPGVILYCALFWIQGKTVIINAHIIIYCTVPYFGFKAKRKSLRCSSSSLVISIAPMWLRSFL